MQVETPKGLLRSTDFPGRQGRLVFARLACSVHPVPRDELAEIVWPDRLPRSWERDLSAVVSKVRALLVSVGFEDPIVAALGCYQLRLGPDAHVDLNDAKCYVEDAEAQLRSSELLAAHAAADVAANHCLRPFLPGEDGDWIAGRRAEQHQLLLRALDVLVDVHIRRGILPEARRYAYKLVDLEPYRESGYAALIRAQLATGDRADALTTYERARALFVDELGVPPGAALEAAYHEALMADAPSSATVAGQSGLPTGTVTLLFTDLVGSTALVERLAPDSADAVRRSHFDLLREVIAMRGGHEVKSLGDGLMVVFPSTTDAVASAVAIQQAVEHANRISPIALSVGVGLHVGEPVLDNNDYFGIPVAVAKRLCDAAAGGQILASDVVRSLDTSQATFHDRRELTLRGMSSSTVAWSVEWKPLPAPTAHSTTADPSTEAPTPN